MSKQNEVQRHRIHFFLEENIKEVYKECNKAIKLAVLKDMIKDLDNE
tara:strand:- start:581 stop:721 length:141 start_codon:yes stop_codon:yes gene_type:complete